VSVVERRSDANGLLAEGDGRLRVGGAGIRDLIALVERTRDDGSVVGFVLIVEGGDHGLVNLERNSELGRSREVDILEGVVAGKRVVGRTHAESALMFKHGDSGAGRDRDLELRDGFGSDGQMGSNGLGHDVEGDNADQWQNLRVSFFAAHATLEDVEDSHVEFVREFDGINACGRCGYDELYEEKLMEMKCIVLDD
jgi:hypothetical protein